MAKRLRGLGLGLVLDIVPNHMAVPANMALNRQLWSVLRDGRESPDAQWFDIDWAAQDDRMLLPILGAPLESCLGDLRVEAGGGPDGEPTLRYFDHVLPLRPGTAGLPMPRLLESQHYRPAWWRDASTELNWRRFFNVTSLIGVRVEEPAVFDATHEVIVRLVAEGLVDGLRIDHPDGLADPRGYLARLASATNGAWVVVEKILEADETLPVDWACAGTTGYDGLKLIDGLFVDPGGAGPLTAEYARFTQRAGEDPVARAVRGRRRGGQARGGHRDAGGRGDAAGPAARRRPPRRHRGRDPDRAGRGARRVPGLPGLRAPGRTPVGGGRGGRQGGGRVGPRAAAARAPRAGRRSRSGRARPAPAGQRGGRPGGRARRPVPADDRPGAGQGRRGHGLLPVVAAARAQRGRRRPRPVRARARRPSTGRRSGWRPTGRSP